MEPDCGAAAAAEEEEGEGTVEGEGEFGGSARVLGPQATRQGAALRADEPLRPLAWRSGTLQVVVWEREGGGLGPVGGMIC